MYLQLVSFLFCLGATSTLAETLPPLPPMSEVPSPYPSTISTPTPTPSPSEAPSPIVSATPAPTESAAPSATVSPTPQPNPFTWCGIVSTMDVLNTCIAKNEPQIAVYGWAAFLECAVNVSLVAAVTETISPQGASESNPRLIFGPGGSQVGMQLAARFISQENSTLEVLKETRDTGWVGGVWNLPPGVRTKAEAIRATGDSCHECHGKSGGGDANFTNVLHHPISRDYTSGSAPFRQFSEILTGAGYCSGTNLLPISTTYPPCFWQCSADGWKYSNVSQCPETNCSMLKPSGDECRQTTLNSTVTGSCP